MASDVLILGAGLAGLAAAEHLQAAGRSVSVLEARDRIGGRAWSFRRTPESYPVELGAEWIDIHGHIPGIIGTDGLLKARGHHYIREGDAFHKHDQLYDRRLLKELGKLGGADRSVELALEHLRDGSDPTPEEQELCRYIEGFHAARPATLSLRWFLEVESTQSANASVHRATMGVSAIPAALAGGLDRSAVELETIAHSVAWKRGRVRVATTCRGNPRTFEAESVIVTLPLPVLKGAAEGPGAVRFTPGLDNRQQAMDHLDMGHVYKVTLEFKEEFWRDIPPLADMLFLQRYSQPFPTWWTMNPARVPLLCGWAGGPAADRLVGTTRPGLLDKAVDSLAGALGMPRSAVEAELVSGHLHDWQSDPYAGGSYTNVLVGGLDAWKTLAEPLQGTLFFAGEATCGHGFNATMEGAIESGRRAAKEVLAMASAQ